MIEPSTCRGSCLYLPEFEKTQHSQKRDYDLRLVEHHYSDVDLVYKFETTTKVSQSQKLRAPWTGPYLVVARRPPLKTIRNMKKEHIVHHDKLKMCQYREIPV